MARGGSELVLESREFDRALRRAVRELGRNAGEVLREEAGFLSLDMAKASPPFAKFGGRESWAVQRRVGRAAVSRDVRSVIGIGSDLYGALAARSEDWARQYWAMLSRGDERAALEFAERILGGAVRQPAVGRRVDPQAHQRMRNRRGRVQGRNVPIQQVVEARARQRYVREVQGRIGFLKAGWLAAAMRFRGGKGAPAWLQKQVFSAGSVVDGTRQERVLFVELRNRVRYAAAAMPRGVGEMVLSRRVRAMNTKIRAALRAMARRARAA